MLDPFPRSGAAGEIDLAHYGWCLDLSQSFSGLRRHAIEEAGRVQAVLPAADRQLAQLNLLLLICAAEQVASDHLLRGGLDLGPIRDRLPQRGIGSATRAVESSAALATRIRNAALEGELADRVVGLRALALDLGAAIAADEALSGLDKRVTALLSRPGDRDIELKRCKMPACFRSQDLAPEDCFELARRFLLSTPRPGRVLVVGIRTSGSYLAPLCAGWLREQGVAVDYVTIRPKGSHLHLDPTSGRLPDIALVVDDPPMTGGSLVATARRLEKAGLDRGRIRLLVPWGFEHALQPGSRFRGAFDVYERIELGPHEWSAARELRSDEMRAWVGALYDRQPDQVAAGTSYWESGSEAGRSHLRQVFAVDGSGEVEVKGVGLGWFGYPARLAAARLEGRVPPVLGFRGSFMASRRLRAGAAERPAVARVSGYVAAKAHALALGRPAVAPGGPRRDGWYRLARLLARVNGPLAPLALGSIQQRLRVAAAGGMACLIDGRVAAGEWVVAPEEPDRFLKSSFEEHCFDKDEIDWPDPASDLAVSLLALGPSRAIESALTDAYARLSGDTSVGDRVGLGELLQGAVSLDRSWWSAESAVGTFAWQRLVQDWLASESAMTWVIERLLAGRPDPDSGEAPTELWSIDVDGVLEDHGLGLPATTPAGVESIARLRQAGAAVYLNTGRSPAEVLIRCDSLGLDGGVAEYGGALALRGGNRVVSLLDPGEADALAAVRMRALEMDGVHVDGRYQNSARLRRRDGDGFRGLLEEQTRHLLEAGEGEVEVVEGDRQTDFKSRRRNKATGLEQLLRQVEFGGRVVAVGDGLADRPLGSTVDALYAPSGSHPALRGIAVMTRGRRQRGLLEAVLREHPGPAPARTSRAPGELLIWSLLKPRDRPRPWRLAGALTQAGLEAFRC
jgi:hydroxymethylpyrimidine pyrophosphatase-like HAD family hydrolase